MSDNALYNSAKQSLMERDQMDMFLERETGRAGGRDDESLLQDVRVEVGRRLQNPTDSSEWAAREGLAAVGSSGNNSSSTGGRSGGYGFRADRPNTGPKGVIEDQRDFKRAEYEDWQRDQANRIRIWEGKYGGGRGGSSTNGDNGAGDGPKDDDDDHDDEEEDAFLAEYRAKRIAEMQRNLQQSMAKKRFGVVRSVSAEEYMDVVEGERPDVFVVVAFSDERLQICRRLDKFLADAAQKHSEVSFVRVHAAETDYLFSDAQLPVLIFYKSGTALNTVPAIGSVLGSSFTLPDLLALLARYDIIDEPEDDDDIKR